MSCSGTCAGHPSTFSNPFDESSQTQRDCKAPLRMSISTSTPFDLRYEFTHSVASSGSSGAGHLSRAVANSGFNLGGRACRRARSPVLSARPNGSPGASEGFSGAAAALTLPCVVVGWVVGVWGHPHPAKGWLDLAAMTMNSAAFARALEVQNRC